MEGSPQGLSSEQEAADKFHETVEYAERRLIELRGVVHAGTCTVAESLEAVGWLGLTGALKDLETPEHLRDPL